MRGRVCVDACACRACGEGSVRGAGGRCVDEGCAAVDCAAPTICRAGACVDPCAGAVCPRGQACMDGACVDVAPMGTDAGPTPGDDGGPPAGDDAGGAGMDGGGARDGGTGGSLGSGCGCRVGATRTPSALALLALALLAWRRRR
ncbi:MAG: MYXO-CTERM sorting domain-containing protein [Sandaracinaceae bacterium]